MTHALSAISSALTQMVPRALKDEAQRQVENARRVMGFEAFPAQSQQRLSTFDSTDVSDTHARKVHPLHTSAAARAWEARPFAMEPDARPIRASQSTEVAESARSAPSRAQHSWDYHVNGTPLHLGATAARANLHAPDRAHSRMRDSRTRSPLPTRFSNASAAIAFETSRQPMAKETAPMDVRW